MPDWERWTVEGGRGINFDGRSALVLRPAGVEFVTADYLTRYLVDKLNRDQHTPETLYREAMRHA